MAVVGAVLAGVALLVILSWWTAGTVSASEGLILFVVYGGLIFGLFVAPTPLIQGVVLLPLLGSAAWCAYAMKKGSLRQFYLDRIKTFSRAVDFDPRNLGARRQLAETLYKIGDLERAISEMQTLIQISRTQTEERHLLHQWQEEKRLQDTGLGKCYRCGGEFERGVNWCPRCEKPLLRLRKKSWLAEAGFKGFMVAFVSLALAALSLVVLPTAYAAVPIGCLVVALMGWKILKH